MLAFDCLVRRRLKESIGDICVEVPEGRCKVEVHEGIVSLTWTTCRGEGGNVTVQADRLEKYLETGSILIIDPAQLRRG